MLRFGIGLFIFLTTCAHAQENNSLPIIDSIRWSALDSLQRKTSRLDSIVRVFQFQVNSLQHVYDSQVHQITSLKEFLQSKADSLTARHLRADFIQSKVDSLTSLHKTYWQSLTSRIEALKQDADRRFDQITLPPQLQEQLDKIKESVQKYSLPAIGFEKFPRDIPILDYKSISFNNLNELRLDNLNDFTGGVTKIQQFTSQAVPYVEDIKKISLGDINEMNSINEVVESQLSGLEGMDQLTQGKSMLTQIQEVDSSWIQSKAKELVTEQLTNLAQDHFAGKQELLQQSMDKLNKFKLRYTEVQSVAELPKRLPNPLNGKPFIERILPGITFQIQKADYFLLDVNPTLVYRVNHRINAGLGWNQRLSWDGSEVNSLKLIYGPRAILEVRWVKGINFRLLPEVMNTTIPPKIASSLGVDPAYREWVPSVFVGIKKDFTVYKSIKGNTEVLYNLYDKDGKSPYNDRLSIRFGFEFPMKRKAKQEQ